MLKNIKSTIDMIRGWDRETLQGWRYTLFFFVLIDIFVFYWWMKWKNFGIAMLIVCLVALAIILILERKFPEEEEEKSAAQMYNKKKLAPVMKNKDDPTDFLKMDLGIPNAEDYNERLDRALTG